MNESESSDARGPHNIDRVILLRRHFWSEIARMKKEIESMRRKLELLDEVESVKLASTNNG